MLDKIYQSATPLTLTFIVFITICTYIFHSKFTLANANKAPAILTTCGILGTFFGIALGLLDFDVSNVTKSVPALIDGIKTAFWVSAWGILCALTIKLREAIIGVPKVTTGSQYQGATVDDLATLMRDVKNALVGSEESTLLGQIKLARQDSNDRIDSLKKSLDDFANKVADNNSKALIDALKEVIKDFNTKINEQFGENFKHLNQAVGKLLEWQEQYRQQVSEMIEQQTQASKNMVASSESMATATERYQSLVKQAEVFNTISANASLTLKGLSEMLNGLEAQRGEIGESLKMLAGLINSAATGLPEIEKKIVGITDQLGNSVKATSNEFNDKLLSTIRITTKDLDDNVKQVTKQLGEGIKSSNEELKSGLLKTLQTTNQEVNSSMQKINQEMNGNIQQLIKKTSDQILLLDRALEEELKKSLESLGKQLGSLSQKFANDYTPITDRLRKILEMAERAS
jgi:DNA anti-recombination protein RmuC